MNEDNNKRFALFTGCLIDRRFPGFEAATRFIAEKLNWELLDGTGKFSCCPDPVWFRSANADAWLLIAGRNLAIASEANAPLLTICNGCFETLNTASRTLNSDGNVEKLNQQLSKTGLKYNGNTSVFHIVQVLTEYVEDENKLQPYVVRPLSGLRLAPHPGCHLIRPSEIAGFDDPLSPKALSKILKALGAEVVEYDELAQCCGLPIFNTDRDLSLSLALNKIKSLADKADAIVVPCPSCYLQFETAQILTKNLNNKLPVLFFTEVVAIAFGIDINKLAMKSSHRVPFEPVLEKLEVLSNV